MPKDDPFLACRGASMKLFANKAALNRQKENAKAQED